MKHKIKLFFNKLKLSTSSFFIKLRKWFVCACKFFDDTAHNRADSIFNLIAVYILVAINLAYPALSGESSFDALWLQIVSEIVYALFVLFFIACTILYHKKSVWCWISNCLFIAHYITLIDSDALWNKQFILFYLGLVFTFFCSWASWASAKDINKKGGLVDTILLALGLTLSILGFILKEGNYEYYKYFIVSGIGIVYLYAIARVLFWLFTSKEETKFNLIKVIIYVAFYIALIVGLPFLLTYAGVEDKILNGTIIPIYAAAIGGVLTLAGVAWTIKHTNQLKNEDKINNAKPFFGLLNNLSTDVIKANNHTYHFSKITHKNEPYVAIGNFVNSDKNCFILKKIIIDNENYTPDSQYMISKGEIFQIMIFDNAISDDKEIFLTVTDENYNEWLYKLNKYGTVIISMEECKG